MKNSGLENLKDFLRATPAMVEQLQFPSSPYRQQITSRTRNILKGAALTSSEQAAGALSKFFTERLTKLMPDKLIYIANRFEDKLATPAQTWKSITQKYKETLGYDDGSKLFSCFIEDLPHTSHAGHMYSFTNQEGFKQNFLYIIPPILHPSVQDVCSFFLHAPPSCIRDDLSFSPLGLFRAELAHECLGHGTGALETFNNQMSADRMQCEFRADIADMADSLQQGDAETAQFIAQIRDISVLRLFPPTTLEAQIWGSQYMNGCRLRLAFNQLAATPGIRQMDDVTLLETINRVSDSLAITPDAFDERMNVLHSAHSLIRGVRMGNWRHLHKMMRETPDLLPKTITFLASCMEGYKTFINPDAPAIKPDCIKLPTLELAP